MREHFIRAKVLPQDESYWSTRDPQYGDGYNSYLWQ